VICTLTLQCFDQDSEQPEFLKTQPTEFWGFSGFWALLGFRIFLFERAVGNLVG